MDSSRYKLHACLRRRFAVIETTGTKLLGDRGSKLLLLDVVQATRRASQLNVSATDLRLGYAPNQPVWARSFGPYAMPSHLRRGRGPLEATQAGVPLL